jgi:hypothetical protein
MQALEQAAKEMGDVYTNRRSTPVSGADGGPVEMQQTIVLEHLTDEDLAAFRRLAEEELEAQGG